MPDAPHIFDVLRDAIQDLLYYRSDPPRNVEERGERDRAALTIRDHPTPIPVPGEDPVTWTHRLRVAALGCRPGPLGEAAAAFLLEASTILNALPRTSTAVPSVPSLAGPRETSEGGTAPADPDADPRRLAKTRISRDQAERLVADFIAKTPPDQRAKLTIRALQEATGVSLGLISKLDSWQKLLDEKAGSVRAVQATEEMYARVPNPIPDAIDPVEAIADEEVLNELLKYASSEAERMRYREMPPGERWLMLEMLKEQDADARRDQRQVRREHRDR